MTGSLQMKNGKFYMVLNVQENGKRKMKWISTGLVVKGNKRKAEQMLRETLQTYEIQQSGPKCDMLFSDYIQKWLEYVQRKVDEVTYQGYELLAQRQIIPWFKAKGTKLEDVTLPLLQVLGLKWDSIDFDAGTVTIRHTVSKVTKAVEKDKTKNATSYRSFPLTNEARSIFQAAKTEEQKNRRLFGKEYQESDYVFKWPDGHSYSPDYITEKFPALLKKHGMPHIRLHELRHSCASLLINAGFTLKDVQEWMGHADIKMTANIYGHLDVSRKQSMAAKLSGDLSAQC